MYALSTYIHIYIYIERERAFWAKQAARRTAEGKTHRFGTPIPDSELMTGHPRQSQPVSATREPELCPQSKSCARGVDRIAANAAGKPRRTASTARRAR